MGKESFKLIANNKKARFDYFIEDTYEAGICLHGTEVKSLRMGKCSVKEAFVKVENGEVYIYNMHISPYEKGNISNVSFVFQKGSCIAFSSFSSSTSRGR